MKNFNKNYITVGVIGLGTMGRGIAQIIATSGIKVLIYDTVKDASINAIDFIKKMLSRLLEKNKIDDKVYNEALNKLVNVNSLDALKNCNLIIEAVKEDINIKKELFKNLEEIVSNDCILATNTSSLSVTDIAAYCKNSSRIAGFHFFNPVPLMKIVEVVKTDLTSHETVDFLYNFAKVLGHNPVLTKDSPGFIVNHVGRAYSTEAMAMFNEAIAPVEVIDTILKLGANFKMGPFELFDLTGLDVSMPASESIYYGFYEDPKYRPSFKFKKRLEAGLLGRKVGEGFYKYEEGKKEEYAMPSEYYSKVDIDFGIWVSKRDQESSVKIVNYLKSRSVDIDNDETPKRDSLIITTPFGLDATSSAISEKLDPSRVVAIDTFYGFENCKTLMPTIKTSDKYKDAALRLFNEEAAPAFMIEESPGFIIQRVLSMIVNIATTVAEFGIATPYDIDKAVKLGLGYPYGPFEWGDIMGLKKVYNILENLYTIYKDPRYRPTLYLKRRAQLEASLIN
jgi:3-hydroxybutyryl-CoA dehydrogenase